MLARQRRWLFILSNMAKRFAETKIWDDEWFQELPIIWKCVWKYLCDKCDEAGVWKVNFKLANFQIGLKVKWEQAQNFLNNGKTRIDFYDDLWVIKDFVTFQYGEKVWDSEHSFHKHIREKLDTLSNRVSDRVLDRAKVMVKEKVMVNKGVVKGETSDDFFLSLKSNPAYKGIDIDRELGKMDAWLLTPKGKGRKKNKGFIVNWLNKCDPEIIKITKPQKKSIPYCEKCNGTGFVYDENRVFRGKCSCNE